MQDGWRHNNGKSNQNHSYQPHQPAQPSRQRGGRYFDAAPISGDPRSSQQQGVTGPLDRHRQAPTFVPQRIVVLMGLPGSGTALALVLHLDVDIFARMDCCIACFIISRKRRQAYTANAATQKGLGLD